MGVLVLYLSSINCMQSYQLHGERLFSIHTFIIPFFKLSSHVIVVDCFKISLVSVNTSMGDW